MAYYFDETYYLNVKLAQTKATGQKDSDGKDFTVNSLKQALQKSGFTPQSHYENYGAKEGLNPNPYFNESEYLQAKLQQANSLGQTDPSGKPFTLTTLRAAITASGMTPAEHYEQFGAYESDKDGNYINPSNAFDANAYFIAKLAQVRGSGETVNGKTGNDIKVADLVNAIKGAGMSPVTHYSAYGAKEVGTSKIALVQTVPVEQRVPNDEARDETGDFVPTNYNPATPAPKSVSKPAAVTKPQDVGGKAPTDISPEVLRPDSSPLVPGDEGYRKTPAGLNADTNEKPVIPPKAGSTDWIIADMSDGSGTVIKVDGSVGGTYPAGSISDSLKPPTTPPTAPAAVNFTATTKADTVTFAFNQADVFATKFGVDPVAEVQSADFAGITLAKGEKITIKSNDDKIELTNNSGNDLSGVTLASYLTGKIPFDDWAVTRDGAKLLFTAKTAGEDYDDIDISYTKAVAEAQSVDLSSITLGNGKTITFTYAGKSFAYTNNTGADSAGMELAGRIVAATEGLDGWTKSADGAKLLFTAKTAGQDLALITGKYGDTDTAVTVVEDVKGAEHVPTDIDINEDVKGVSTDEGTSLLAKLDTIAGFKPAQDRIEVPHEITGLVHGELKGITVDDFKAVAGTGTGKVGAWSAGVFRYDGDNYLFINDGDAAFNESTDIVIKLVGVSYSNIEDMTDEIFITPPA